MAYIGREPQIGNFQVCDAITTSATATYNLLVDTVAVSPETANHCIVSLNGVIQKPGATGGFTISGSTIVFASALTSSDVIDFIQILGSVLDLGVPSDDTVSLAKLTATGTKDATTFLRGDNTFAAAGLNGWSEDGANNNLLPASASAGIYLGVSSATAANLLDDYEEGTFTPSFSGSTGAPSGVSYASRLGIYTKIGRIVQVDIWMNLSSWSSAPSGGAIINGLPFTSKSDGGGNYYASGSIAFTQLFDTDNAPKGAAVGSADNHIALRKSASSDARNNVNVDVSASAMNGTEDIMVSLTYQTD